MKENLKQAIAKYKAKHPRASMIDFGDGLKEYKAEQPGLDIIEELEKIIMDLKRVIKIQ